MQACGMMFLNDEAVAATFFNVAGGFWRLVELPLPFVFF